MEAKTLKFYTEVLGFLKKADVPMGNDRWLTVISSHQPDGPELLLEPMGIAAAKTYQKALFDAGIPLTSFTVADVAATHARLQKVGVIFRTLPMKMGPVTIATFEDTCGNLIQVTQQRPHRVICVYSFLSRRRPKLPPPAFEDSHKQHVTVADRLTQLQSMRGEGLISEEEYKLQRTRILNEI